MRKLYIWGRGEYAKKLFETQKLLVSLVDGVIDSNLSGESFFYSKPVVSFEEIESNNPYIIIATSKYYSEIKEFLENKSLKYLDDYCDYDHVYQKVMRAPGFRDVDYRTKLLLDLIDKTEKWLPMAVEKVICNPEKFREIITTDIDMYTAVLDCCADKDNNMIQILDSYIEYDNIADLLVIFREIMLNEEYYFHTVKEEPTIVDAGANIGLAVLYFKYLYPKCKIIAFEPNEKVYGILHRNIIRNGWENVSLYQVALSDRIGDASFYIQKSGIAGSMERRNQEGINEKCKEVTVKTTILNNYMPKYVDFLKMDIEGSETVVIEKLGCLLNNVEYLFIEFHEGKLKGRNSISKILGIVEEYGFDVNVGKSYASQCRSEFRPMNYVGSRISEVIYAKRKS